MAIPPPSNLLDEALDGKGAGDFAASPLSGGRMVLVEDCVETGGAFVLHHLLKRCLSPHSSDAVVFLSFAHPFSHYDRILRKMGCNLSSQRDNKRLLFFDMLMADRLGRNRGKSVEDIFVALYGDVHRAVELFLSHEEGRRHVTLIVDDVSLMEIDAKGSSNLVLDFLHYCHSLTSQFACSFVALNHDDVYSTADRSTLLLQMEYLAEVVIKVEPLATGLAKDVHGQFRIKDSSVEYFYPGSKT
ncbi:elongator complex protein 6 isoform X2 [Andrographis paniculata]|uniref:elongator complex protein 6 isoform X2 n=1 Tax=Andrographis paniculata TaxID=175694 RepID=UPI0021E9918E|nr:elongator complex protein 6 isoform X2 [Andrographis paniculata]